ncbi:hypothetical protein SS50377_27700 [Spironucleus salmonicida]|uniref:Uncharacterized protein n=1 Tax=Spironucleus salmonicida TaxID=348837 RepID=V6M071_9EUKA|nr:hypothetical protein SS50377_27700 [Spironucleus salmonicida]|eukprot:EST46524.1 Hypothetical protein SS50377_13329 [Spironucleus salmonicida]
MDWAVIPDIQFSIQSGYFTQLTLNHKSLKLPANAYYLYRIKVTRRNQTIFYQSFSYHQNFIFPTYINDNYEITITSRIFFNSLSQLNLEVLKKSSDAASLILENGCREIQNGVMKDFIQCANSDQIVAECCQYAVGIYQHQKKLLPLNSYEFIDIDQAKIVFLSCQIYFSNIKKINFEVTNQMCIDSNLKSTGLYGLYIYCLEDDNLSKQRIKLQLSDEKDFQYTIYSKIYQQNICIVPGLSSGSRICAQTQGNTGKPQILRDQDSYTIFQKTYKIKTSLLNPQSIIGKEFNTAFIIFNQELQLCQGITGSGKINFEVPLYQNSLKQNVINKNDQILINLFKLPEFYRAIQHNLILKKPCINLIFYISFGLNYVIYQNQSKFQDSLFSTKQSRSQVQINKYVKKNILQERMSFGLMNHLGYIVLHYDLIQIISQLKIQNISIQITSIIDGVVFCQEDQYYFTILVQSILDEVQTFAILTILFTGDLINIFPLDLNKLYNTQLYNDSQQLISIQQYKLNCILLVFQHHVSCFNTLTGQIIFTISNKSSQIKSNYQISISNRIFSSNTKGQQDPHEVILLTSEFLPTSQTEESDEIVVTPDNIDNIESSTINQHYAPQYMPLKIDQLEKKVIVQNSELGEIMDCRIFEFRKIEFVYFLQRKKNGIFGIWMSKNDERLVVVGVQKISQFGITGQLIQQVDSVFFIVQTESQTILREFGLFGEARRSMLIDKIVYGIEFSYGLEGKVYKNDFR